MPDPFPHLVVRNAIDGAVCNRLIDEFPPLDLLFPDPRRRGSNVRGSYSASSALADPRVSPIWREMIATHVSQGFLRQALDLFADSIRAAYPWLEGELGRLETLRAGVRSRDTFDTADLLLEAQPSANTPVTGTPTSVRAGHLDNPDKLLVGLFYLRPPEDRSTGGDLELYRYATRRPAFDGHEIGDRHIERVRTIPYEKNVLVLFLNSPRSLHGVSVRSRTPAARLFLNLGVQAPRPLFAVATARPRPRRLLAHVSSLIR